MDITLTEGRLSFTFKTGILASQYDEWQHHLKHLQKAPGRGKAVDFLAIESQTLHFIEVKDYREITIENPTPSNLPDVVAQKVNDSLAGIFLSKIHAHHPSEKEFAQKASDCTSINVHLHIEQKSTQFRTNPEIINLSTLKLALEKKLRFTKCKVKIQTLATLASAPYIVNSRV